jgi:hypothetical protein
VHPVRHVWTVQPDQPLNGRDAAFQRTDSSGQIVAADVKSAPRCDVGLPALPVDTARRRAKTGDQRRDLRRFFRHDGERDVFLRLRSKVVSHF